jgi:hypothetical protein
MRTKDPREAALPGPLSGVVIVATASGLAGAE